LALNERQKAFADYYIQTGNATEAAIKAGYSEKTAYSIGNENLKKPEISAYIGERMAEQGEKRVADANEVIEFYTAVMRGEVKDQFGLDASLSDRLKAGDALMKRYAVTDNGSKGVIEKLDKVLGDIDEVMNNGET
jgi:phage terminase small subunit